MYCICTGWVRGLGFGHGWCGWCGRGALSLTLVGTYSYFYSYVYCTVLDWTGLDWTGLYYSMIAALFLHFPFSFSGPFCIF